MNRFRALALICVVGLVAACTADEEPTRRRTTTPTDVGSPTDTTDTTDNGDNDGDGTAGILILEATAASVTGTVGQQVTVTAQGWLDSAKTTPVTSGTMISFTVVGAGVLTPSQDDADAQGRASVAVGSSAPGAVTVTASLDGVTSNGATVVFQTPVAGGGTGGGSPSTRTVGAVTVTPTKTAIVVNNDSAVDTSDEASVYVTVTDTNAIAYPGVIVLLSSTDGSLSAITGTTNAAGTIGPIKFTAGIAAQDVVVSAKAGGQEGAATITVGPGAPLIINVADPLPAQIGVRGSGNESSVVTFTISDKYGNPVSDNTAVSFSIYPPLAGVSVSPSSTTTHDGKVSPVVNAGTKAGTVRLIATVASVGRSISSGKITVFGGVPSQARYAMAADTNVHSGLYHNGLISNITVTVTDRYGNPVVPGTAVYVSCEAGRCGANNDTGISTDETGHAAFEVESAFQNLVWKSGVTTTVNFGGAIGTKHRWPALNDPRDGKVKVIAASVGESGFDDSNSNGIFDAGDLLTYEFGEPFDDINDNGTYDDGTSTSFIEDFWDFNADGVYSAATGSYQERTYIWDSHTLIWTDWPAPYIVADQFVDVDADGVFDPDEDLIAAGGPGPINQAALLARFPWLPATATLNTGYANFVTTGTTVRVNFSDLNNNPLPKGSTMSASNLSNDLASVDSPPSNFLTYSADYATPMSPRVFSYGQSDSGLADVDNSTDVVCANVRVGDTSDEIGYCIPAVVF